MSDVLERICRDKRDLVTSRKAGRPYAVLEADARAQPSPRGFATALEDARRESRFGLIAEIKKASPSKGLIREDFDPPTIARAYQRAGATCLSVLTDEHWFQGHDTFIASVRAAVDLPVLRKDFMIDPYQVVEARAIGADCILIIMAAVDDTLALELEASATELGMDCLIEVHDAAELDRALTTVQSRLIGINNRNLRTLEVDIATTERLAGKVDASRLVIGESGLYDHADLERLSRVGVTTFLVGESLMRQPDIEAATRSLLTGAGRRAG